MALVKSFKSLADVIRISSKLQQISLCPYSTRIALPKKPPTAYAQFVSHQYASRKEGELKLVDVVKILSAEWKNLPAEDKEAYKAIYKDKWALYRKQIASLSEEDIQTLKQGQDALRAKRKRRKERKLFKSLGKPKKPLNAFLLFLEENRVKQGAASHTDFVASMTMYWKRMSQEEKLKFTSKANVEFEKYSTELKLWKEEMKEKGYGDLVAPKSKKSSAKISSSKKPSTKKAKKSSPKAAKAEEQASEVNG